MTTANIRISTDLHKTLKAMAKDEKSSMQMILNRAVYEYQNKLFFQEANRGYQKLQSDPKAWTEELAERKLWENTLMDGIDEE